VYIIDPISYGALASSYEGKVIDSASIDQNGNFSFKKLPYSETSKMYLLTVQNQNEKYPNKLENDDINKSNYIPFLYQGDGNIIIESSANHLLRDAMISGTKKDNDDIMQLIKNRYQLHKEFLNFEGEVDESNLLEHEKALYKYQKALLASVAIATDAAIHALALRWSSPNGDYERIPELVKQTCETLNKSDPNHAWTAQICKKATTLPLAHGDVLPDFPLPMIGGDTVTLHSLLDKKLTLVDLWASWCAPCRHENKNTLVPLWDEFHTDGFQIIGYALDSSDKGWKNAINKDGASRWPHASHLNGDDSPFFKKLKISTIPANYLIDEKGVILAKNLHGDELRNWVSTYMKK
jgi:thiol-disulfide isomerase/thioredoxin